MNQKLRYRTILILPNENNTNIPFYFNDSYEHDHKTLIDIWCKGNGKNKLSNSDLVNEGYVTIHTVSDNEESYDIIICYVPLQISEKQYEYLLSIKDEFLKYKTFGMQIEVTDSEPIVDNNNPSEIIDYFYEILKDCLPERGRK